MRGVTAQERSAPLRQRYGRVRDVVLDVKDGIGRHNIGLVSAGVAFYALLALMPALAALMSIYGLFAAPEDVERQIESLGAALPDGAREVISEQLTRAIDRSSASLSLGALGGLLFVLWSATRGTRALITATGIAYGQPVGRGMIRLNATALLFTLGTVVAIAVALGLIALVPHLLTLLNLDGAAALVSRLRWPLLAVCVLLGLAVLYRIGPGIEGQKWRWVSWGAVTATILWLVGSALFSTYVANFGSYNETYGSLGAVIVVLFWFYLSAYVVLLGAELNAALESRIDGARTPPSTRAAETGG
jgi:membrane protein